MFCSPGGLRNGATTPRLWTALTQLEGDARRGLPSSLPVVQSANRISWLSVAASRRELREYLDDARAWLPKADAAVISGRLTVPSESEGPLAQALLALAPHGYVRWDVDGVRGRGILRRLSRMHRFLATRPQLEHARVPSVAALRLEFVSALKVGNWARAEACVNEIDHWTLDHASATLQMRIRLLDARGETTELFGFIRATRSLEFHEPATNCCRHRQRSGRMCHSTGRGTRRVAGRLRLVSANVVSASRSLNRRRQGRPPREPAGCIRVGG